MNSVVHGRTIWNLYLLGGPRENILVEIAEFHELSFPKRTKHALRGISTILFGVSNSIESLVSHINIFIGSLGEENKCHNYR
jgi:hypothetical protein